MKILIATDGSECAGDALEDLKHAGFPANTEALILTVTENWTLILEELQKDSAAAKNLDYRDIETLKQMHEAAQADFATAENIVAAAWVRKDFPSWRIRYEAAPGFVPGEILTKANEWKPDLIIVGSHGRGLIGRAAFGSTSLKILSESPASVRVARRSPARSEDDDAPQRIVIGFDGSHDSMLAVEAVAKRAWRQDAAARLVTAIELLTAPGFEIDLARVEEKSRVAAQKLAAVGLHVSTVERMGEAKRILVEEAEKWGADAIFLGAQGHRLIERFLLGSVSYAVAARARCSVEVVREQFDDLSTAKMNG